MIMITLSGLKLLSDKHHPRTQIIVNGVNLRRWALRLYSLVWSNIRTSIRGDEGDGLPFLVLSFRIPSTYTSARSSVLWTLPSSHELRLILLLRPWRQKRTPSLIVQLSRCVLGHLILSLSYPIPIYVLNETEPYPDTRSIPSCTSSVSFSPLDALCE